MPRLKYFLLFILLLAVQRLVLDNIRVGYFHPPVLIFAIVLIVPRNKPWQNLLLAFGAGMVYDILSGTPGLNAMIFTFLAYLRSVFYESLTEESDEDYREGLGIANLGFATYFFTVAVASFVYHALRITLSSLSAGFYVTFLLDILYNAVISTIFIYLFEILALYRKGGRA